MQRLLLVVGLIALVIAVLLTITPLVVRGTSPVETLPVDPAILDLLLPTVTAVPISTPAAEAAVEVQRLPLLATLQQGVDGYTGCVDTYMDYYEPNSSFCNNPTISVRAGDKACMLLRFDLSVLPEKVKGLEQGALVQQATLSLFVVQGRADTTFGIYRLRRAWDACAVTWNLPWQKPGANGLDDRDVEPVREWTTVKSQGMLDLDVTALVQEWLQNPASNQGILLKSFEMRWPSNLILFSSDHPAISSRPKLTIKYEAALPTPTEVPATATHTPTPEPTSVQTPQPSATPQPSLGPYVMEVRWRERMNKGNPYGVTLVFRSTDASGAAIAADSDMRLTGAARLTAPSFDITATTRAEQTLDDTHASLVWSWTIVPRVPGPQVISLDVLFSKNQAQGTGVEPGVWYHTIDVVVEEPMLTWAQLARIRDGMAALGTMCVLWWYILERRRVRLML